MFLVVEMPGGESLNKMILIINVCKEKLHYYEFVKPIEDMLKNNDIKFFTKNYKDVTKKNLKKADGVIMCGTSLKDNEFLKDINKFDWIKTFDKSILGICAGMQIIGLAFGGKIKKSTEIGFYFENFKNKLFGLSGEQEVYHLHNNFVDFGRMKDFEVICQRNSIPQAVKHKNKEIYGVLFHPEVRQKSLILSFSKI